MIKKIGLYLISCAILCSCTGKKEVYNVGVWVTKEETNKPYKRIYISSMMQNAIINSSMESAFGKQCQDRGIDFVKHSDYFTASFIKLEKSIDQVYLKMNELNCDAILTIGLLDVQTDSRYVPSEVTYDPFKNSYYDSFYGYYNSYYDRVVTPGYYVDNKVYYLECNLFDAKTKKLLFSVQSKAYNPKDIDMICKAYSEEVINTLKKKKVLTKVSKK